MRPIWSGTISFGLVSVPVRMFSATESKELRFHFLHKKDLAPIGYDKVRKDTGKHVDPDESSAASRSRRASTCRSRTRTSTGSTSSSRTRSTSATSSTSTRSTRSTIARPTTCCPEDGAEKPYRLLVRGARGDGQGRSRQGRDPEQAASRGPPAVRRRAPARDDVLRRRGSEARERERQGQAAEGRGRDGQVPRQEPERLFQAREVRRHVSQGAPRPDQGEGEGQGAAGAVRGAGGRGRRPDGGAPRVGQGDEAQEQARPGSGPARQARPCMAKLAEYKRKRDPKKTPEPFGGRQAREAADLRRPAPRRAPAALRLPPRAERRARELGGARRASRSSPASSISPSTSRTIRSSTRRSRARSRRASTAPARSRSGTTARTSSSRRSRTAASPSACTASGSKGTYALVPAHLSGDEQNWLILRKKDDSAPRRAQAAQVRADVRHARPTRCRRATTGSSRSSGTATGSSRRSPGGEAELRIAEGPGLHEALRERRRRSSSKALKTPDCVVDGEVCALDEEGRPSFSAMQQGKTGTPIVYYVFDLLEVEGEPLVDLPLERAAQAAREAARQAEQDRPLLGDLRRRRGAARGREAAGARRDHGQAPRLAVPPGQAHARLAEDQGARPPGVRRSPATRAARAGAQGTLGSLVLGDVRGRRARLRRQRRHRVQRPGDRPAAGEAEAARARRRRRSRRCRRCRACARATWSGSSRSSSPRSSSSSGRTTAGCARPSYQGLREDKAADEVHREEPSRCATEIRKGKRVLKLSNLDKPFWPDEGITKGDLLAYYRRVAPVLVPAPARTARSR